MKSYSILKTVISKYFLVLNPLLLRRMKKLCRHLHLIPARIAMMEVQTPPATTIFPTVNWDRFWKIWKVTLEHNPLNLFIVAKMSLYISFPLLVPFRFPADRTRFEYSKLKVMEKLIAIFVVKTFPNVEFWSTDGGRESLPKYYLQIYTFVYPLIPQVSPCIKTEFGAILLPNINIERNENSGLRKFVLTCCVFAIHLNFNFLDIESIGLIVKKEKEEEFIATLENILQTKIIFCNTKEPAHVSVKISDAIVNGKIFRNYNSL